MKKKTLCILALAITMCGVMTVAGGCNENGGPSSEVSAPTNSVPVYSDKIEETPTHYGVSVTEGEGYKIHAVTSVEANGRLEFTVEFDENYDGTNASVLANGVALTPVEGIYALQNVTENITISVSGLVRSSYSVLLVGTDGVLLTGDDSVKVGQNYSFTLLLEEGAVKGTDFAVKVNGEKVASETDTYVIPAVDKDLIVTVSGVTAPYYSVSGLKGTGYAVSAATQQVMKGKAFSFAVNVDEAYEKSAEYSVTVNGNAIEAENGIYTVNNVQSDLVIAVSGLSVRQKFTVTYKNCDLTEGSVYVGSLFHLPTPSRSEYLFDGWKDKNGEDFVMDYSGDVTVYASWITGGGVNYVAKYQELAETMATRYDTLKAERKLNFLNIADYEMKNEYLEMYGHFTEYERETYAIENASVEGFLSEAEYIPYVVLAESPADISVSYDNEGVETSYSGYHGSQSVAMEKFFDGGFYSLQSPTAEDPCLTYYFTLNKLNFKKYCDEYGRVSVFMSGNYAGMSLLYGETMLAYTLAAHVLQRIDIQDGYLYLNGNCCAKLSEATYNGEESLRFTVIRQPSANTVVNDVPTVTGHYYAQWDVSHVYGAKRMEGYSTTVGEGSSLKEIRDNIFSNTHTAEPVAAPTEMAVNGATKAYVYEYTEMKNFALDNIALGEYERIKFFVKVTGNVNIWGADGKDLSIYFDKLANWTEIKLIKNGNGYDLYVNGVKSTAISNINNLNVLAFNGHAGGTITYTNLIAEL